MKCLCFPADFLERYKKTAVVISFLGAKVSQSDSFNVESKEEFTSDKLINNTCVCVCGCQLLFNPLTLKI